MIKLEMEFMSLALWLLVCNAHFIQQLHNRSKVFMRSTVKRLLRILDHTCKWDKELKRHS